MPKLAILDRRSALFRAQKRAKEAIVRELGTLKPLQNIIADEVAFDTARLEILNRQADPDPKRLAELSNRRDRGLHNLGLSREGPDWLKPLRIPTDEADEQSSKVA